MDMLEREGLLGQLLQADNDVVGGSFAPGASRHQSAADLGELLIVEDADGALLDIDSVAGVNQGLGGGGSQSRPLLSELVLRPQVEDCRRHGERSLGYGTGRNVQVNVGENQIEIDAQFSTV